MKKLALVALIVLLNGCALIDAYRMARFDNNEYALANSIHTQAQIGAFKCGTLDVIPYVDNLYLKSVELRNYSAGIDHNEEAVTMTNNLLEITRGLKEQYAGDQAVSQKFCEMKFSTIEKNTTTIQKSLGAKPK